METQLHSLVGILGPTAVGKTRAAIQLAEELHGEIVSADSRLVYRGMDIGTAKPTLQEQRRVPHHLIDLVEPGESFSLAQYQQQAYATIADIHARGKVPFLVGGSGLYVRAVLDGLAIPRVAPNLERRQELEQQATAALYTRLRQMDPIAADRIDPRNKRRIIRAIEVSETAGEPISRLQSERAPSYRILRIGLTLPREELYRRINARVDAMMASGLVEEVKGLIDRGYPLDAPAMSGLGYRQIALYVRGEATLDEAVRLLKRDTRRFVHHQYSWFRLDDPRIRWFDLSKAGYDPIRQTAANFLRQSPEDVVGGVPRS
ncbi:MAG: tRNA (adenosine(37)-N6)-dimethylallyltransferase MiaA [Chloroflexi bacterium]|nr:tRNA (adenosine(37)-N6)-dimethylallyltransferase MiaA [Chloroflexota bacterium]